MNEIVKNLEEINKSEFGKRDINAYHRLIANIDKGFQKASDAYITVHTSGLKGQHPLSLYFPCKNIQYAQIYSILKAFLLCTLLKLLILGLFF